MKLEGEFPYQYFAKSCWLPGHAFTPLKTKIPSISSVSAFEFLLRSQLLMILFPQKEAEALEQRCAAMPKRPSPLSSTS